MVEILNVVFKPGIIDYRLQHLERKVYIDHGEMPREYLQLKEKVECFKDKLEVGII